MGTPTLSSTRPKPGESLSSILGLIAPEPRERRYPHIDVAFFRSAIDDAQLASLMMPVSLSERVIVRTKKRFDTACWAFLPPHRIYMGLDLFQKKMVKAGLPEELQRKYIGNHLHHEQGHGLFTIRDMKRVKASLSVMSAPFPLYNLFEDAYMEERYRHATGYQFEWLLMEDCSFNARPESLLFALIQAEGDVERVESELKAWKPDPRAGDVPGAKVPREVLLVQGRSVVKAALEYWLPHVVAFYRRTVAVTESMQLMPIVAQWIDRFGLPPESDELSDLMIGSMLAEMPSLLGEFDEDSESLDGERGDDGFQAVDDPEAVDQPASQKGCVLATDPEELDLARAAQIAAKLKKFFVQKGRRTSTDVPQKRISARNFVLGRPYFRVEKLAGRAKRKIVMLLDCSGSMDGEHIEAGRVLIAALSRLARENAVEGYVVATGGSRSEPAHETYELPVSDETVRRMQARHGAENISAALSSNLKLLAEADHVFVFTDGQLSDRAVQKAPLHAKGIATWGLYVGSEEALPKLLQYFDKALIRSTIEELTDAILAQL